jgi:hypothetical protein
MLASAALESEFRSRLLEPLADLRRRCRLYLALGGTVHVALALLIGCAVQFLLDRLLNLSPDQRAFVNIVLTAIWLRVAHRRLIVPVTHPLPDRLLAAAVDRVNPALADRLATAVEFAQAPTRDDDASSSAMVDAMIREACDAGGRIPMRDVLNHAGARRAARRLAGLAAVVLLLGLLFPATLQIWFQRNWLVRDIAWPQRTYLTPAGYGESGVRRVPRDDELAVTAEITGQTPDAITLEWWTDSGARGRESMTIIGGDRAEARLGSVRETLHFRLIGGDEHTRPYHAVVVDRPTVVETRAKVTPPAYLNAAAEEFDRQTNLEMIKGSHLAIEARLNKPVRAARFVGAAAPPRQSAEPIPGGLPSGPPADVRLTEPDRVRVEWAAPASGSYAFELEDLDGWESRNSLRFVLRVQPDTPPVVRLESTDVSELITPVAEFDVRVTATDNFGLGSVTLLVQRNDETPGALPGEAPPPGKREHQSAARIAARELRLAPGDRIRVWAEAADQDPAGPNASRSEAVSLRVVTPADFLAEMARREQELRQEFERLISEQNGLRDALERAVAGLAPDGPTPTDVGQRLAGMARRQEGLGQRVASIRTALGRILVEMRSSRVLRSADERRYVDQIDAPLAAIIAESIPKAAQAIQSVRRQATRTDLDRVIPAQADLIRRMRAVLASLMESEGFREAVALLQEILDEQNKLRGDTESALSEDVESIIGPESSEKAKSTTPTLPKP